MPKNLKGIQFLKRYFCIKIAEFGCNNRAFKIETIFNAKEHKSP